MGIWKKFSTWICGKKGMALMLAVVTAILAVAPAAEELTTFASQSDDAMKKGIPVCAWTEWGIPSEVFGREGIFMRRWKGL